jgi:hypothetical protein
MFRSMYASLTELMNSLPNSLALSRYIASIPQNIAGTA